MRVLHLANHCDEAGNGIMNVAVDLACGQADLGHAVAFASAGGAYVDLIESHGVGHTLIDQPWRRPWRLPGALARLRRLIREWRPEIVHAHMMTGAVLARTLRRNGGFRLITTVHNEWQRSATLMTLGNRVIAVSDTVADQMHRRGIPRSKLRVVRNATLGTPRWRVLPQDSPEVRLQRPSIVTVAGMNDRKGIPELIRAFGRIAGDRPDATLYLVGRGPGRTKYEALSRSMGLSERIQFTGFARDPRPYFQQADIFVLASRSEPFGLVLSEAREAGCAIVATRVGGIPEALEGGRAGILVPAEDPASLAEALARLLDDPQERELWRRRAAENTSWLHLDRAVAETMQVYEEALQEAPRHRSWNPLCRTPSGT